MTIYAIEVCAALENVVSLTPITGVLWKLDIESDGGGDFRENITIDTSADNEQELDGSRGTANFIIKWSKGDSHQAYIKMLDIKKSQGDKKAKSKAKKAKAGAGDGESGAQGEVDGTYRSQTEEWVAVACMECRGLKPTKVHIGHDFNITTSAGTLFEEAELALDGQGYEWAEYDEKNDLSVSVSNLQARLVVVP